MMSKEKRRVPKLRFPGFTEDWEQRKLSDILVERNEQQVETNEYPLMSFVQGHGVIPKGERYDRSFLVLDQSKKYKRTELGDFIYSSNNLETGSIGINKTGKAVISPVYSIFYGVSIGDSQFIGIMSLLPRFIAKMIRFRQGVVYGQWRIHEKDFLDISILIPSEAERTKITKLILSIEELITLHQRKLNNLKLKKKALLQKLFPKNEERYPELRFPGFTDAWEQRKLESLFTKYEDKVNTPSSGYWRLGLRSHCKGTFHTYIDAGNELETAEMNRVKSGNFILNITFAWERALAVTNDEDQDKLVSHRFPQFKPNSDLAIDFFKHTLIDKRFKHHLELSSPGGAGRNKVLKVADMLKYELLVPSIKEQNKISSFLNHVDYIITLHQRKLDHLQLQKKALLQQMFV